MLEWMIPNKESNTLISKSLKELIEYVSNNNIKNYTIKGWGNNKWETLISPNNSFEKGGGIDDFKMSYDEMTTYEKSNHIHYNPMNSRWEVTKNGENKEFWNQEQAEKYAGFEFDNDKDSRYSRKKYEALFGYAKGGGVDDADWIEESLIDLQNEVDMDDLVVENSDSNSYTASNGDAEFLVFETEDDARERAIERVKEDLEENPQHFNRDWLMNYVDAENFFTGVYDEWNESYVNDIESEDSDEYANRLIEEMVDNGIVSNEEANEEDFDAEDYKQDFINLMTKNQIEEGNGGLQHYIDNIGEEEAFKVVVDNNLIDIESASESAVDTDGVAHFLSSYDGEQIDLSNGHVAYRTN
jgi:hypothetical protein